MCEILGKDINKENEYMHAYKCMLKVTSGN